MSGLFPQSAVLSLALTSCGVWPDRGGADGGPVFPEIRRVGHVAVSLHDLNGRTQMQVSTGFYELIAFSRVRPEFRRTEGPCEVTSDRFIEEPADAPDPIFTHATGGAVTFASTGDPITLLPDPSGLYEGRAGLDARWTTGARVSVRSAGGVVPAFMSSIVVPSPPGVIAPSAASRDDVVPWVRGEPFVVQRRPGTLGTFHVTFNQGRVARLNGNTATFTYPMIVECAFPAATEVATIPAAALRDYAPSSASPEVETRVSFWTDESTTLTAGDYSISVSASYSGLGIRIEVR